MTIPLCVQSFTKRFIRSEARNPGGGQRASRRPDSSVPMISLPPRPCDEEHTRERQAIQTSVHAARTISASPSVSVIAPASSLELDMGEVQPVRLSRSVLLIILTLAGTLGTSAVETPYQPGRPRIALVLSGGGARGSAHVGVLKVLEELRIPVDMVVGTSMGAIVGGLYSSGVSPEEMEVFLAETNWRDLLDNKPPTASPSVPAEGRRPDLSRSFRGRIQPRITSTATQPPRQRSEAVYVLQSMTLPTAGIEDFDLLPIPFRAVATDLEKGDTIVIASGDLGSAMRASMSVPGVFSPVEIDGRLLVDGGIVDNLPVDVARAMGADIVIAVDVGTPLLGRDALGSISGVTSQMMSLQMSRDVAAQAANADVLIDPTSAAWLDPVRERQPDGAVRGGSCRLVGERSRAVFDPRDQVREPPAATPHARSCPRGHDPLRAAHSQLHR